MKYKPRHPVLNLICAALCFVGGLILLLSGLFDLESPRIWRGIDSGLRSSTGYGIFWGGLWMVLGAVGVHYHIKYLRNEGGRTKKK